MEKRYLNNKGDAKFKLMLISLSILIILCAALFSRMDIEDFRRQHGTGSEAQTNRTGSEDVIKEPAIKADGKAVIKHIVDEHIAGHASSTRKEQVTEQKMQTQSGLFYYDRLTEEEKQIYCQVLHSIQTREDVVLSTRDTEQADKVFQLVLLDHPEIFDTNGYQIAQHLIGDKVMDLTLKPKFDCSLEQKDAYQSQIDNYVNTFLASVPMGLDQYGKVKYVYEKLISETEYDLGAPNSQNICSVFLTHRTVCAGYAKATQYLLQKLDIPSAVVQGMVGREGHAWNLVYVDGQPYYLDTTWGDASYLSQQGQMDSGQKNIVNYDYFLITQSDLEKTHTIDNPEFYPVVVATQHNYFQREGLYFYTYDKERLRQIIELAYANNKTAVSIRVADKLLLYQMEADLIDNQEIFQYLRNVKQFYYQVNEDMCTMTFWLQ